MIVRIMGDNQYRMDDSQQDEITRLDGELVDALEANNQQGFQAALERLTAFIREHGTVVPDEELVNSNVMVPAADMTLTQAQEAIAQSGSGGA